jgi:hypothetical protein
MCSALVMCASELGLRVEQAPEYTPQNGSKISVFGVFHDGRMDEHAWLPLEPKLAEAFGGARTCEPGYGKRMREGDDALSHQVDHLVRENGIDDDVLEQVAPAAQGDFILVLMLYKKVPQLRDHDGGARVSAAASPMGMGRRGGRGGAPSRYVPPVDDDHVFELSASLFSRAAHKLVAQLDLRYTGDDLDAAMSAFAKKLETVMPGATCAGWNWPTPDDVLDASEPDDGAPLE